MPLGLTAVASLTDGAVHKKMFGSGHPRMLVSRPSDLASRIKTLIISNDEMNDIVKIVKLLEESGLLIKDMSETFKMKQKNKKADFSVCY